MQTFRAATALPIIVGLVVSTAHAQPAQRWDFDDVGQIEIEGLSGDLIIRGGSASGFVLELVEDVHPSGRFRADVGVTGSTLRVRERWRSGRSNGRVEWTLSIPADIEIPIAFDSTSGGLEVRGVNARIRFSSTSGDLVLDDIEIGAGSSFHTTSGDIRLSNMAIPVGSSFHTISGDLVLTSVVVGDGVDMETTSGDLELSEVRAERGFSVSTASGTIRIDDSEGEFRASTASGDVRVIASRLTGPSEFSSASGNVTVTLAALPRSALALSSASGDVLLETTFGSDFTLVMSKRLDRGRIDSPFVATRKEEYRRRGTPYIRQTIVRGSASPEVRLRTASGSIRVLDR